MNITAETAGDFVVKTIEGGVDDGFHYQVRVEDAAGTHIKTVYFDQYVGARSFAEGAAYAFSYVKTGRPAPDPSKLGLHLGSR